MNVTTDDMHDLEVLYLRHAWMEHTIRKHIGFSKECG
jgi:hypothetical protein